MSTLPLSGVRVLEAGEFIAAPFAAKILGSFGATVIKLEPLAGDYSRRVGPFIGEPNERSGTINVYLNGGKRSVAADAATPAGFDLVRKIAKTCDVILCDDWLLRTVGWDRGMAWLQECDGVRAVLTPYGTVGAYAGRRWAPLPGYMSGVYGSFIPAEPSCLEFPDRLPVGAGGFWGEYQCGAMLALPVAAAFVGGSHPECCIELSRQDALCNLVRTEVERFQDTRETYSWRKPFHSVLGGIMRVADGYLSLSIMEERQWRLLMEMLGSPEWAAAPELASQRERLVRWPEVYARLQEELAPVTRWAFFEEAQARGVPTAPILTPREIIAQGGDLALGNLAAAGSLEHVRVVPGLPFRVEGERGEPEAAGVAPRLGGATVEVLRECGYDAKTIELLRTSRTVRQ